MTSHHIICLSSCHRGINAYNYLPLSTHSWRAMSQERLSTTMTDHNATLGGPSNLPELSTWRITLWWTNKDTTRKFDMNMSWDCINLSLLWAHELWHNEYTLLLHLHCTSNISSLDYLWQLWLTDIKCDIKTKSHHLPSGRVYYLNDNVLKSRTKSKLSYHRLLFLRDGPSCHQLVNMMYTISQL